MFTWLRSKKRLSENYLSEDISELSIEAEVTADSQLIESEKKEIVLKAVNSLPSEQKEVILLKNSTDFLTTKFLRVCGIDTGLVKSRLYSARQKLIAQLSDKINK
ncbi:MAG: hypothetical protein IPG53_11560 [Ignavibacteriales bacterium]|nr:hypothetical protein [Ignavibacteriales bacterium]